MGRRNEVRLEGEKEEETGKGGEMEGVMGVGGKWKLV